MKIKYKVLWWTLGLLIFALVGTVFAQPKYYGSIKQAKYDPVCLKTGQPYFVLVSWNMGDYTHNKTKRSLGQMADVLRDADIVVLQNIYSEYGIQMDIKSLALLLDVKDRDWDYITNEKFDVGKGGFAFLWNTKKVFIHNVHLIRKFVSCSHSMERAPVIGSFYFNKEKIQIVSFLVSSTGEKAQQEIWDYINCSKFNKDNLIALGDFNLSAKKVNPIFQECGFVNQTENRPPVVRNKKNGYCKNKASSFIFTKNSVNVCGSGTLDLMSVVNDEDMKNISEHWPVFIIFQPALKKM